MTMLRGDGVIRVDSKGVAWFAVRADAPPTDTPGLHGIEGAFRDIGATWSRKEGRVKGWFSLHAPLKDLAAAIGRLAKPAADRWIERLTQATRESGANLAAFHKMWKDLTKGRKGPGIGD